MGRIALLAALATIIAACGGASAPAPAATGTPAAPTFLSARLTDVRTGETFSIGAFPGKVVLVIAMAVW